MSQSHIGPTIGLILGLLVIVGLAILAYKWRFGPDATHQKDLRRSQRDRDGNGSP